MHEMAPNELVFYDRDGKELDQANYLALENAEVKRFADGFAIPGSDYLRPPETILTVIAAYGLPALSEHDVRFKARYTIQDTEVLEQTLASLEQAGLLISEPEPNANPEKPSFQWLLTEASVELTKTVPKLIGPEKQKRPRQPFIKKMAKFVTRHGLKNIPKTKTV